MTRLSLLSGTPGSDAKQEDDKNKESCRSRVYIPHAVSEQRREPLEPDDQTRAHTERVSVGKVNHKFECAEILLSGASLGGMFGAVLLVFPTDTLQNTQLFFYCLVGL